MTCAHASDRTPYTQVPKGHNYGSRKVIEQEPPPINPPY